MLCTSQCDSEATLMRNNSTLRTESHASQMMPDFSTTDLLAPQVWVSSCVFTPKPTSVNTPWHPVVHGGTYP